MKGLIFYVAFVLPEINVRFFDLYTKNIYFIDKTKNIFFFVLYNLFFTLQNYSFEENYVF